MKVAATLAMAGCAACVTAATQHVQQSRPQAVVSAWLAAYNTGHLDTLRHFAEAHFDSAALTRRSAQARAESDRWLFMNLGPMRLVNLLSATDSNVSATVFQSIPGGWGHVSMRFSTSQAGRITAREVSFFDPPPSGTSTTPIGTDIGSDLGAFAERLHAVGVFSGVFGVLHDGRVLTQRGSGLARRPTVPNTPDTRFALASLSKMFTAVAIAQLVEQKRLSYQDTVAKLLSDYPNRAAARKVTVAHLLTHTSGLSEYLFNPAYREQTGTTLLAPRDYWPFFAGDSLRFPPGTRWEYSSSNYVVLGAIVERISGQNFYAYVREHVFEPAGMTHTTFELDSTVPRATPYTRFGPDRRPDLSGDHAVTSLLDARGGPAGGGLSTAEDLLAFAKALLDGRLLDSVTLAGATSPRVPTGDGTLWSYGFETQNWHGIPFFGHNGFAAGTFNQLDIFPTLGYAFVVLSNTDMSGAGALSYHARLILTSKGSKR